MYYTRQEILQNYSTKADIAKLGYEELKVVSEKYSTVKMKF